MRQPIVSLPFPAWRHVRALFYVLPLSSLQMPLEKGIRQRDMSMVYTHRVFIVGIDSRVKDSRFHVARATQYQRIYGAHQMRRGSSGSADPFRFTQSSDVRATAIKWFGKTRDWSDNASS